MAVKAYIRILKADLTGNGVYARIINNTDLRKALSSEGFQDGDIVEVQIVKETKKQGGDLENQTHGILPQVGGREKEGA
jgi:hypothetical protein